MTELMDDEAIREAAIGAVENIKGTATPEEIEAAIAQIGAERAISDEDRRGE